MVHASDLSSGGAAEVQCRSCGKVGLNKILSLGQAPLTNALLTQEQILQPEPTWPLELAWCPECSLVQVTETVPSESMAHESAYFSSFSESLVRHAKEIATDLTVALKLDANSLAIEVGSNDGYLLQWYKQAGVPVLGIESAHNIARMAEVQKGVPTISEAFSPELVKKLSKQGQQADVLHANNVLTYAADLNGFVAGLRGLLKPTGVLIAEVPYLKDLIDQCEFDTIYHEHLSYFSLTALDRLFRRQGLMICEVEKLSIHGGSLRVYARHLSNLRPAMSVSRMLAQEDEWVYRESYYSVFGQRVDGLRSDLVKLLKRLKSQNKRIAVYGATAKGSMLLNSLGIGPELLDYAVDRSTIKHGRFIPGSRLQIFAPDQLVRDQPDYCLLLSWNIADEILAQQQKYRDQGGKFIIPLPNVRVA